MRQLVGFVLIAALMAVLPAASACGDGSVPGGEAREGRWEAISLPLPPGSRYAAYDAAADTLWILTWPHASEAEALLTEYNAAGGAYRTNSIRGPTTGLGVNAGLAVDGDGFVWAAWGSRLIRYDPGGGQTREWLIPSARSEDIYKMDPGLDGVAVDVAIDTDSRVWVAVHSLKSVWMFNPGDETWEAFAISPLVAVDRTRLSVLSNGSILLNGTVPLDAPSASGGASSFDARLAAIDPASKTVKVSNQDALQYAVLPNDSVPYVDSSTHELRVSSIEAESDIGTDVRFDGIVSPVSMAVDSGGAVWLWQYAVRRVELVRLDVLTRETTTFPYPVVSGKDEPRGPTITRPVPSTSDESPPAADPGIQAIVVDKRNDVWVISDDGPNPPVSEGTYPALYRVSVEQQ